MPREMGVGSCQFYFKGFGAEVKGGLSFNSQLRFCLEYPGRRMTSFDLSVPCLASSFIRLERLCLPFACLVATVQLCMTKTVLCEGDCLP